MANILIVDDEPYVREMLCEALAREGHKTSTAVNGLQALQALDEQGPFDVVITDYRMPILDGRELTKAVLGRKEVLPVIMVSGDPDVLLFREVFTALEKPIDLVGLTTAVDAAVLYRTSAAWAKTNPT